MAVSINTDTLLTQVIISLEQTRSGSINPCLNLGDDFFSFLITPRLADVIFRLWTYETYELWFKMEQQQDQQNKKKRHENNNKCFFKYKNKILHFCLLC